MFMVGEKFTVYYKHITILLNEYQEYPYDLGHRGILAFDLRTDPY